jgi:hypothetical protein
VTTLYSFFHKIQHKPTSLKTDQQSEGKDPAFTWLDQLVQLLDYYNPKAIYAVRKDPALIFNT